MADYAQLRRGLAEGSLVPILGPGALEGARDTQSGEPMPADSRSLILAMNNGREMMPRLMYEFSRAAQHLEQRRGQAAVARFLSGLYSRPWSRAPLHEFLAGVTLPWVVDLNRDTQLLDSYAGTPHILIQGVSRIMAGAKRFVLFAYDGRHYRAITEAQVETGLPVLFKPLGCPHPEAHFIASDADFVDYLTELMGGFALPDFLKAYRRDRQYLLLGVPLTRDTERMLVTEISYGAAEPRGWAVIADPTPKERRFCERIGLTILETPLAEVTRQLGAAPESVEAPLKAL